MLSLDQILKMASIKSVIPWKIFFEQSEFLPKDLNFTVGIFKILKNKACRSIIWNSAITKMAKIWRFRELFNFYLSF